MDTQRKKHNVENSKQQTYAPLSITNTVDDLHAYKGLLTEKNQTYLAKKSEKTLRR